MDTKTTIVTFVFSIINFLLLAGLLYKFLNKPLANVIAQRRRKLDDQHKDADTALEDANKMKADYEALLADIDRASQEILTEARQKGEAASDRLQDDARQRIRRQLDNAELDLARQREETLQVFQDEIVSLSVDLTRKALAGLVDTALEEKLFDRLRKSLSSIDAAEKSRISTAGGAVTVTSAAEFDDAARRTVTDMLADTLNVTREPAYAVNAKLIAGVRIEFETLAVESSLAAVLTDFAKRAEALAASAPAPETPSQDAAP